MGEVRAMDTDKWKSVIVPIEVYDELKVMSHVEGRTISGQLRWMFEVYKDAKRKDPVKTVG